jgi:aspartyl-tRNA(Asn)/glutamyl-tRNA(Gln) amidotransferase subunit A
MRNLGARELLLACRERAALREQVASALRMVDVLALPTVNGGPAPYALRDSRVPIADTARTAAVTRFAFLANLTGLPAISFPVGTHHGLPVSMQVIGDAWDEASIIAVAAHAERLGLGS